MRRREVVALTLMAGALLAGCDSGPSGPGALTAVVEGTALGGVVIEVRGDGIVGFEGLSSTQVYAAPLADDPDVYRVLLVHPDGGDLRFEIQVDDVGMDDPVVTVVSVAGADNRSRLNSAASVRIER